MIELTLIWMLLKSFTSLTQLMVISISLIKSSSRIKALLLMFSRMKKRKKEKLLVKKKKVAKQSLKNYKNNQKYFPEAYLLKKLSVSHACTFLRYPSLVHTSLSDLSTNHACLKNLWIQQFRTTQRLERNKDNRKKKKDHSQTNNTKIRTTMIPIKLSIRQLWFHLESGRKSRPNPSRLKMCNMLFV